MPRQRSSHRDRRPARAGRPGRCPGRVGLALAALAVAAGGSVLAAGQQPAAAAAQPQVSISILSVSPQVAGPRQRVTVAGTVSNPTGSPVSNLAVTLWSSTTAFTSRAEMASYAADDLNLPVDAPVAGAVTLLPGSLAPGTSEQWTVTVRPANLHLTQFGVYPLAAQVTTSGRPLAHQRTFLPFWPGSRARAGLAHREKLAWVWPLIGQPQQQACAALLTNDLAGSLATSGRLGRLLADGSAPAASGADLTWAIDPSLVASAKTMTRGYRVGGTPACAGATGQRASAAARAWLAGVTSVTARQDFFTTPYADVDSSALTHAGLGGDLTRAYTIGRATAQALLGGVQRPAGKFGQIAWPAAGIADYAVLSSLAAHGIGTVVLNSSLMPPKIAAGYTPSAITTTPDGVNAGMRVALADSTLSQVLAGAPTAAGSFAAEQRFLAETAMIAAEQPQLPRTVVVTPPRQWNPAPGLASQLLAETTDAPWLRPASLASLVAAHPGAGQVARRPPPQREVGHGELHRSVLHRLRGVAGGIRLQASMLGGQAPTSSLASAVATVESSAWRGDPARPRALLRRINGYLDAQWRQVRIVGTGQDTLTGRSGSVPVSINNKLNLPVTVQLRVWAPSGRITVEVPPKPVVIGPHQQRTVAVRVHAAAAGTTVLKLQLFAPNGQPVPGTRAQLTVDATHFGSTALLIVAVACGVFVITAVVRGARRRSRSRATPPDGGGTGPTAGPETGPGQDANGADPAGSPGESPDRTDTVVSERARDDDTPEEPDEYASAPSRVERPR